ESIAPARIHADARRLAGRFEDGVAFAQVLPEGAQLRLGPFDQSRPRTAGKDVHQDRRVRRPRVRRDHVELLDGPVLDGNAADGDAAPWMKMSPPPWRNLRSRALG